MAAAVVAIVRAPEVPGNRRWGIFTFTPSTSYPATGEPMTASLFGMLKVDLVIPVGAALAAANGVASYDATNNTLTIFTSSTGAVAGTGTDQSLKVQTLLVIGV